MKLLKFDTINSTNTYGKTHFSDLEDKTIITAKEQTNGRGRFDRIWVSKNCKNLYLSIILKPNNIKNIANLTQYLSVITAKIIESYSTKPQIKWPNDILINDKKISGILCEGILKNNKIAGVVLGIGINLNSDIETLKNIDKPATSLNIETNKEIDDNVFLNNLLDNFFKNYDTFIEQGFSYIKEDYLKYINFLGTKIQIQQNDKLEKVSYLAKEINNEGNLVVIDKDQKEKIIYSGDLIL